MRYELPQTPWQASLDGMDGANHNAVRPRRRRRRPSRLAAVARLFVAMPAILVCSLLSGRAAREGRMDDDTITPRQARWNRRLWRVCEWVHGWDDRGG